MHPSNSVFSLQGREEVVVKLWIRTPLQEMIERQRLDLGRVAADGSKRASIQQRFDACNDDLKNFGSDDAFVKDGVDG